MSERPDAIARFAWSLRHYWVQATTAFLVVLILIVGVGTLTAGAPVYSANALVVPRSLGEGLDALRLSRFQQAVFEGGGVIEASLEDDAVPYEDRTDLLDHVRLAPVEDNIALNVVATDEDPAAAAAITNVVTENLVRELNRVGISSAGAFAIHTSATPPDAPDTTRGTTTLALVGIIGGIAVAVGLAGTLGALRRPALAPADAVELLESPLLGHLSLPTTRKVVPPSRVLGLAALVRRLYPDAQGTCAFVAPEASESEKIQVASLVARALARRGPTLYVTSGETRSVGYELRDRRIAVRTAFDVTSADWGTSPTVVEGPSDNDRDLPQLLPLTTSIVVVVAKGETAARLQRVRQQFLPGEILGVVFVQRHRRRGDSTAEARPGLEERLRTSDAPGALPRG